MALCRNCGRSRCCADGVEHCSICQVKILLEENETLTSALQHIDNLHGHGGEMVEKDITEYKITGTDLYIVRQALESTRKS
jgi:hypothetical protein